MDVSDGKTRKIYITFSADMCVFGTQIVIHVHVGMGDVCMYHVTAP